MKKKSLNVQLVTKASLETVTLESTLEKKDHVDYA